jgi:ribosomal protein S18 acetylase RimI-like enzyme
VIRVTHIDHRLPETARELHAVQMAAYRQEAALLGVVRFPPLERTVADIAQSSERFLGAYLGDQLAGALGTCPDEEEPCISIASLVVSPAHQRGGIARMLVSATVAQHPGVELTVQTGAGNAPALALYERFGFRECRRWRVGDPPLELVKLKLPVPGR